MTDTRAQPNATAKPTYQWRVLCIQAAFIEDFDPECVHPEDTIAPGYYEVMVPAEMDDTTAAACAMGGFHSEVPINHLYMFEFTVYDESGRCELEPDDEQDWYELAKRCGRVYRCGKEYEDEFADAANQSD